jgi:hypothetical protein
LLGASLDRNPVRLIGVAHGLHDLPVARPVGDLGSNADALRHIGSHRPFCAFLGYVGKLAHGE